MPSNDRVLIAQMVQSQAGIQKTLEHLANIEENQSVLIAKLDTRMEDTCKYVMESCKGVNDKVDKQNKSVTNVLMGLSGGLLAAVGVYVERLKGF